jgi:dihydroorotate dehydrogenase
VYRLFRPLLFLLPAELAHRLGMAALRLLGHFTGLCKRLRSRALSGFEVIGPAGTSAPPAGAAASPGTAQVGERRGGDLTTKLGPLTLPHPIGLAAGLDKDGEAVAGLFAMGFSFVEVGTVTPLPQPGNPMPRLFRAPAEKALINRMGFNNHGAQAMGEALRRTSWRPGPVGVNLGKSKNTPLERAFEDYVKGVDALGPLADYLVVNASSPNTPGLRALQEPEALAALLRAVRTRVEQVAPGKPLFLKFAPDLAPEAVDALVDVALAERVTGLIATNTTVTRPEKGGVWDEAGGLSGAPLRALSTATLARAAKRASGRLALVGVGGIFTAQDVYEKLEAGADAVQLYSGLIYQGPGVIRGLLRELAQLLGHAPLPPRVGPGV